MPGRVHDQPADCVVPAIARAILNAATEGGRDVTVGMMATLNVAAWKLTPGIAQKMAARQADRQQYERPPGRPEGTLYYPGLTGQIHGHGPEGRCL